MILRSQNLYENLFTNFSKVELRALFFSDLDYLSKSKKNLRIQIIGMMK